MANREDNDTVWIERVFDKNKSEIFHKMKKIAEKKKILIELKSKIHVLEEQRSKLIEYVKLLESIKRRSSEFCELISNICSVIEETQNSTISVRKEISNLQAKRKVDVTTFKSRVKTVTTMEKVLSETYNKNFDKLRQKENRLLELEKETKEYNFSKQKQKIDDYIKDNDILKAKNIRLKEMISMFIAQKI